MAPVRRRLRVWAATWLAFQVLSLAALVPRDCCDAHRRQPRCDEAAAAAYCPMRGPDGQACPMHRGHAGHGAAPAAAHSSHHDGEPASSPVCRITGVCNGPIAALAALLANHGILPESPAPLAPADARPAITALDEHAASRLRPPDSPPPRA